MADPQRDLAPIIEPPAPVAAGADTAPPTLGVIGAIVALLLVVALAAVWQWRQGAPLRAVRQLALAPDAIAAANELAALLRRHGIAADAAWCDELDRLRFGPPPASADAAATLTRLCRAAEQLLQAQR